MIRNLITFIAFSTFLVGIGAIQQSTAEAAPSAVFPTASDFTPLVGSPAPGYTAPPDSGEVFAEVALPGSGSSLTSPRVFAKIYFPSSSGTLRIHSPSFCGFPPDGNTSNTTNFEYRRLDGNENPVGGYIGLYNATAYSECGARDITLTGLTRSTLPNHTSWFVAEIRATMTSGTGVNAFKFQALGGGLVSYKPGTGANPYVPNPSADSPFTIQDRVANGFGTGTTETKQYSIDFGTPCNFGANRTAYVKWQDDDEGQALQGSNNIEMRFIARDENGTQVSNTGWFRIDSAALHGPSGFQVYGQPTPANNPATSWRAISFTAQQGYKYQWQWRGVTRYNGIQMFVPFDGFNYTQAPCVPPATWDYEPSVQGSGTTVPAAGLISVRPRVDNTDTQVGDPYRLRLRPANALTDSYVTLNSIGTPGGSQVLPDQVQYSNAGTGSFWQPNNSTYRVSSSAPDGTLLCFQALVTPDSHSNSGWDYSANRCWRVIRNIYNYDPEPPIPYSTQALYYSGYTYDASAVVRNSGNGTGPGYTQRLTMSPSSITGDPYQVNYPGLAAGGGFTMDTRFTQRFGIPANTPHNTLVTCTNYVTPNTGLAPPSPITGFGTSHTVTNNNCFRVENRQFNIPQIVSSDVTMPSPLLPTQAFDVDVRVCNDGALPAGAQGDISRRTQTVISAAGNVNGAAQTFVNDINYGGGACRTYSTSGWAVDSGAQFGDQACVTVTLTRTRGFSFPAPNGFNVTSPPNTFTQCVDIAEQAYIEVVNSSVWSGGSLDPSATGYGTSWCAPTGSGEITMARLNGVGGWADYVTGAFGAISNFGSAHINSGAIDGTSLTIANQGGLGLFGQGRCITDLATYLSDDTSRVGVSGLSTASSWPTSSGQWVRNGNLTIGAHTINAGERFTIYVNGDVTIAGDVGFGSYNVGDKSQIPSLIIVATGNIDIQDNVDFVHGLYFSVGDIDTCSNRGPSLSQSICDGQLTVVGSFIADDIQFRRTYGGVSGGNPTGGNNEAERFLFSSEMYLANHILISDSTPSLEIEQITDLPPVVN